MVDDGARLSEVAVLNRLAQVRELDVVGGYRARLAAGEQVAEEGFQVSAAGIGEAEAARGEESLDLVDEIEVGPDGPLPAVAGAEVPLEQSAEAGRSRRREGCLYGPENTEVRGSPTVMWPLRRSEKRN